MRKVNCQIDKPYPKVKLEKKDMSLVPYVRHLYASSEGVLQMFQQYLYQILVLKNQEFSLILKNMVSCELQHFTMLGEVLLQLGVVPFFGDSIGKQIQYWNSYELYYDQDYKTILEIDLEQKKKAISNYQMFLSIIQDLYLKEIIQRILEDEYLHLEILMKLYENQT